MAMAEAQRASPAKQAHTNTQLISSCAIGQCKSYDQAQSQGVENTPFPGLGHDKAVDTGRVEEIGPIIK